MGARSRIPYLLALAVAAAFVGVPDTHAQIPYDTLMVANSRCQPPAIAVDGNGVVHVVVPEEVAYRHFWRVGGGPWEEQVISPAMNSSTVSLAVGPTNRLALLRRGANGSVIVMRPGPLAFWDADTVPAPPTPAGAFSALQVDPLTDEPVVAFVTNSGGFHRLSLARRGPDAWSITTVDSTTASMSQPSLALDAAGRIRLALGRNEGPAGQGGGFYYAEADSMSGLFSWTRVDSEVVALNSSLVLDPVIADPRVTYGETFEFRYASRSAGVWTSGPVRDNEFVGITNRPLSLTLDAAGLPRILMSYQINALSAKFSVEAPSCGGVSTPYSVYYGRDHATGTGTFDFLFYLGNLHESGGDALATFGGKTHIVWRQSWNSNCWPAPIVFAETSSPVAVPPADAQVAKLRLGPNPVRSGGALQLRMRLDSAAPVELHLTDIAGRRVARTEHTGAKGDREIRWTLPGLRAGWYRVTARQGGATLGSTSFLVID